MKKILLITLLFIATFTNAQCWESVSVGEGHALGIKSDGTLWSWGYNNMGQLGNGTVGWISPFPEQVGADTNWAKVHSGLIHCFGIKDDGTLWAWGSNEKGKLGIGTFTLAMSATPLQVGTSTWKMVSSGTNFTIGIRANGTLWGWGENQSGTVGDGSSIDRAAPVLIDASTNWKMTSSSTFRTLAIKEDGTLWGWGSNSSNRLGFSVGTPASYMNVVTVPTQIGAATDWKSVASGFAHTIALKNNNTLWTWGTGNEGQLGNNSTTTSIPYPLQLGTATDWAFIETEFSSCFAIKADATLWIWGLNTSGTLGNGNQTNVLNPTQITTENNWLSLSSSNNATAALKTDGSLYTWGDNLAYQIGDITVDTETVVVSPLLINTCNLGTEVFNQKSVKLYPNPVQNRLYVASEETQSYQIYSILGTKISEGTLVVGGGIDCSGLTRGVYLIALTNGSGQSSTLKFVKQ
ncbi:T9SS type A sorting domain-containing protein [Flavobacterium sp. SM2513]|uniref:T9SS type A sorting domain-containing protein n=1 Tax=Flavobacterium sp. SM2513 TaxID=3424766 RepID=UPI003D7F5560